MDTARELGAEALATGLLVAFVACQVELPLQGFVVAAEALVVLPQLFDQGTQLLQLFQETF